MVIGTITSFVSLQLGWFACVLGAAHGRAWLGPLIVVSALAVHVGLRPPRKRATELWVLASAALLGFLVDTVFLRAGVIAIGGATVSPAWLVVLWPNLAAATAPGGSLVALARRPLVGALVGSVAAPISYDAGAHFGAIALEGGRVRALAIIAIVWAAVLPAFFVIRARLGAPRRNRP
jgi:hypothetical protein